MNRKKGRLQVERLQLILGRRPEGRLKHEACFLCSASCQQRAELRLDGREVEAEISVRVIRRQGKFVNPPGEEVVESSTWMLLPPERLDHELLITGSTADLVRHGDFERKTRGQTLQLADRTTPLHFACPS